MGNKKVLLYMIILMGMAITGVGMYLDLFFTDIQDNSVVDLAVTVNIYLEAPGRLPRILSCNSGTNRGQRALDIHLDDVFNYTVCFELFIDGEWCTLFSKSGIRFEEWTEIRCEYTKRRMRIYVNGDLDAENRLIDLRTYSIADCNAPIVLGKAGWSNAYPFTGIIKDVIVEGQWVEHNQL